VTLGDKMADYYPLVSRLIAEHAGDSSAEGRQVLYDRARAALLDGLRTAEPPFAQSQIMRERLSLEDAVNRIEGEVAQRKLEIPISKSSDRTTETDLETADAFPFMVLRGAATGRLNQIWRCAWR
jgi:hypothetical protein